MSSVTTPSGKRRHRSISIRTADRSETMYCGLHIEQSDITRDWRPVDCKACIKRGALRWP